MRFLSPLLLLPLAIGAHEREQITILTEVECQVVTHLHYTVNSDRLLLLEAVDRDDVRVASKDLPDLVLFLSTPFALRISVGLEDFDAKELFVDNLVVHNE